MIIILHTPNTTKKGLSIDFVPIGLTSLANFLKENGEKVELINLAVEYYADKEFNLINYLEKNRPLVVGVSLYWHFTTYDVMQLIKNIKKNFPQVYIVLGGDTASFFANEIMQKYKEVDFVIKGEAEEPFLMLINFLRKKKSFFNVSNLVWRKDGEIVENKVDYYASSDRMGGLNFSSLSTFKNGKVYKKEFLHDFFFYNCGRGCPVNCSFCGGSSISQRKIRGRKEVSMIDHSSVLRELRSFSKNNALKWYTCFDPYPESSYYIELFKKIREEGLKISLFFECWSIPSRIFVKNFKKTFTHDSEIIISPDSGSEKVRKINKGYFYSNSQLLKIIKYIVKENINLKIYFFVGLAEEAEEDFIKTLKLIKEIKQIQKTERPSSRVIIDGMCIAHEPGCLNDIRPEKYNIFHEKTTFEDYYYSNDIGYRTKFFTKIEIIKLEHLLKKFIACNQGYLFDEIIKYYNKNSRIDLNSCFRYCDNCIHQKECFSDLIKKPASLERGRKP